MIFKMQYHLTPHTISDLQGWKYAQIISRPDKNERVRSMFLNVR